VRDRDTLDIGAAIKRHRLKYLPLRMTIALLVLSLPAGGPHRFYAHLPGQVFAALMVLQVLLERVLQAPDHGGKVKDRASFVVGWFGYVITLSVSVAEWYWFPESWKLTTWSLVWVGAAIGLWLLGLTIRIVAIRTLGRYFTAHVRIQDEQQVIQHGIYSVIRHPSYTGMLLIGLGVVTLHASVFGYLTWAVYMFPAMLYRIRIEEKALKKDLGEPYVEYSRRVKRLIPFIY